MRFGVHVGQIHQPQDFGQVAADLVQALASGTDVHGTDAKIALHAMAEQGCHGGGDPRPRTDAVDEIGRDVAHVSGVLEVVAHESFDRQQLASFS